MTGIQYPPRIPELMRPAFPSHLVLAHIIPINPLTAQHPAGHRSAQQLRQHHTTKGRGIKNGFWRLVVRFSLFVLRLQDSGFLSVLATDHQLPPHPLPISFSPILSQSIHCPHNIRRGIDPPYNWWAEARPAPTSYHQQPWDQERFLDNANHWVLCPSLFLCESSATRPSMSLRPRSSSSRSSSSSGRYSLYLEANSCVLSWRTE